ncbi:malignant T-cell-amplified sequence 1 homolog [Hyalella azteca]|uniref:Malignant T-cell-amplified sequence 1 homolog n=1 Tax=Hyalella azteca TaxID=294128 RepID=A0A979FQM0_HYAAZ|nr:malignant T-cell-amplified sequence 1 homolog [Hyalella azteca]
MFKKFDEESVSGSQQLKSSVQKAIHRKLAEDFPLIEDYIATILPKKDPFKIIKCHEHIEILARSDGELLFFRQREGQWMPTLRLLHQCEANIMCPGLTSPMARMSDVKEGEANIMCPGLTSPMARMSDVKEGEANIMCPGLTSPMARMSDVEEGTVVAVMAEGKQHALSVGITKLSSADIASKNKDVGVENCHYLNDGLWYMKPHK